MSVPLEMINGNLHLILYMYVCAFVRKIVYECLIRSSLI